MCMGLRVETAIDGSFCRCRNGSPLGHFVPDTMLTFWPATCARAAGAAAKRASNAVRQIAGIDRAGSFMNRSLQDKNGKEEKTEQNRLLHAESGCEPHRKVEGNWPLSGATVARVCCELR